MSKTSHNYIFYGAESHAGEVRLFIEHILQANMETVQKGGHRTPICIWGTHGIGKTELVRTIAKESGYEFAYIAPAQFEEMGDLIGMPAIVGNSTVFKAPDWVPTTPGPGILLIDDVNRADDRILRGIMQLLQNFELVSWKLPPHWQIVLTANPDGGDYSVTPMDDAMLTRMMHITMKFDAKVWALWAEQSGVDYRGINFVLTYPEVALGRRTTPRSLVQFFDAIRSIHNLKNELALVQMLADSCLDDETAISFLSYVQHNLSELISPEEIIGAAHFDNEVKLRIEKTVRQDIFRVDIMATLCTRLVNYLTVHRIKPNEREIANIRSFIKMPFLPNDLRLAMLQDIVQSANPALKAVLADPEISLMLLKKM